MQCRLIFLVFCVSSLCGQAQKINRQALVQRHNVKVTKADTLSSLTVGNGGFAFTVDATGLQTFPKEYSKGVPLGTQSEWGWHSLIDTADYKREEALKPYRVNGRDIPYLVQSNSGRSSAAANWYRQNPHRLQLGSIGFEILKKDGTKISVDDVRDIRQELDLWTGEIKSHFTIESVPVDVLTFASPSKDAVLVRVRSALIKEGRLKIKLLFPYPTGQWTDEGVNYTGDDKHTSGNLLGRGNGAVIERKLDSTKYYVHCAWRSPGEIKQKGAHSFLIAPANRPDSFELITNFTPERTLNYRQNFAQVRIISQNSWRAYWNSGGAIDFSGSTNERAFELERRIVLSRYLMRVQEAGANPPQETGLTYNSWFGKPHTEMHWWHATHYALWGRIELFEKSLGWYQKAFPVAKEIATRQGFNGVRWPKMTDNTGQETPSSVGALLIWQQPHFIYFAELCYRERKDNKVLDKYSELVFATADFMASFPTYDTVQKRYVLQGVIPAQERFKPLETYNPTYELVYWQWALSTAQQWRERLKMPRNKKWDEVLVKLSSLPVQDNLYLATESAKDSYTNPEFRTDHPSVLAALGVMPSTGQVKAHIMKNTFDWVWNNWSWKDTWGWDFPLTAMTATRLGLREKAIDALLMDIQTNTYLPNGHNYQDDRLRVYMPGNGGLLTAIAMMVAGYDNVKTTLPGIPDNGRWKVKWEGLRKMP